MHLVSRDIIKSWVSRGKAKNILYGILWGFMIALISGSFNVLLDWTNGKQIDINDIIVMIVASILAALIGGPIGFSMLYNSHIKTLKNTETDSSSTPIEPKQMKKYKVYTGCIKKIRHEINRKEYTIRFVDGNKPISVLVGEELAGNMSVGEIWTLGYIDKILVNIRLVNQ